MSHYKTIVNIVVGVTPSNALTVCIFLNTYTTPERILYSFVTVVMFRTGYITVCRTKKTAENHYLLYIVKDFH